jgi:hypothetical protein
VWAVDLAAIYLALAIGPAAGLTAGYLAVVNSLLHIGPAAARREYNPGLITAILLLAPVGGLCVVVIGGGVGLWPHLIGLLSAIGVHGLVVLHVVRRLTHMPSVSARISAAR